MNEEEKEVVTQEESAASTETQETVTEQAVEQSSEETVTPEIGQEQNTIQSTDVDEHGVPWKNRFMEVQRKFEDMPKVIEKTVAETLQKNQQVQKPEYTIEQLEQFKIDKPEYTAWVESEKAKIIQKNLERTLDERLQATERKSQETVVRQQAENWVVNHPKFKECLVSDASGNKVWNMSHPLTQAMGNILNTVDPLTGRMIKDRPDGLRVAAEMAYGRFMLSNEGKTTGQITQLKKDLRKTQKQTIVQSTGSGNSGTAPKSNVKKALDNYQKTYAKSDVQAATRAYLLQSGLIKEE